MIIAAIAAGYLVVNAAGLLAIARMIRIAEDRRPVPGTVNPEAQALLDGASQ